MSVTTYLIASVRSFLVTLQGGPARQFWLNWGVRAAVACFTFIAVVVALFVSLWPKIYRPRLRLVLRDPKGEKTHTTLENFGVRERGENIATTTFRFQIAGGAGRPLLKCVCTSSKLRNPTPRATSGKATCLFVGATTSAFLPFGKRSDQP